MKVAIITNTLHEEIVPLAKHLSGLASIDLFSIISSDSISKGIFFESDLLWKNENCGIIENIDRKNYISKAFSKYINFSFNIHAILLKNMKFYSFWNLIHSYKVARFLKKERFEIIHFNGTSFLYFFLRIFIKNIPFILVTHDPTLHSGEPKRRVKITKMLLRTQKNVTHIVHSESSKKDLLNICLKLPGNNVHIINFGVHEWMPLLENKKVIKKSKILFFGRICEYKGIEYLIKAGKIVKKFIPDLNVTIAGEGDFYFDISDIENDETFTIINKYIANEELAILIKQSEFIVCPYTDATQSGVVMTAFSYLKPVVAFNVGGLSEYIENGKTGILVPPKDLTSLVNAISELLQNKKLLREMKLNIKKRYFHGEYSWDNIARKTFNLYSKLTN